LVKVKLLCSAVLKNIQSIRDIEILEGKLKLLKVIMRIVQNVTGNLLDNLHFSIFEMEKETITKLS